MALKSSTHHAPMELSSVLLVEVNSDWTREERTLAPVDIDLPFGAVLAKNADGVLTPFPHIEAEGDPLEACAVLISPVSSSAEEQSVVVVERGVRVYAPNLFWLDDVTDEEKAEALLQLEAKTIVIQE